MAAATTSLTGKRVTIQINSESPPCTGIVKEVVILNGETAILLHGESSYHLFNVKNIRALQLLEDEEEEEEEEEPASPLPSSGSSHCADPQQQAPAPAPVPVHQCAICLEEIDMMQNAVSTGCMHQFHFTCLVQNMSTSSSSTRNQCPLCRSAILQDHAVYRNDDAERQILESVLLSNEEVRNEVGIARRIRDELSYQFHRANILRDRINHMRRVARQEALALLDQAALRSNLYTRITGLVNSAANNDIRENYHDMHEIFEEEIRNVCFEFALMALQTSAMQGVEVAHGGPGPVLRAVHNQVVVID